MFMNRLSKRALLVAVLGLVPLTHGQMAAATAYTMTSTALTGSTYKSVTFGNSKWLTIGGGYQVDVSTDALSWTTATTISVPTGTSVSNDPAVAFGAGKFVSVGWSTIETSSPWELDPADKLDPSGNVLPNLIHTSTDGVTWTARSITFSSATKTAVNKRVAAVRLNGITYGANKFVAVGWIYDDSLGGFGTAVNRSIVVTSTDGLNWSETSVTTVGVPGAATEGLDSVSYGGPTGSEIFIAVGWKELFTSSDAVTWTPRDTAGGDVVYGYWRASTYGNGTFLVVGDAGYSMTSGNGTTWTFREIDTGASGLISQSDIYSVAYAAPDFFIGTGSEILSQSDPTSTTWDNQGSFSNVLGAAVDNNQIVFVTGSMFATDYAITTTTAGGGGGGGGGGGTGGGGTGGGGTGGGGDPAPTTTTTPPSGSSPTLTPGDVTVTVNGVEVTAEVTPLADGRVRISGPGFSVTFGGTQGGSEIVLPQGGSLTFTGTGYQPGSRIDVVLATTNQSLGSGTVTDEGTFRTSLGLSSSVSEGNHMVQASGIGRDGASRVLQIGVRVSKISRSTVAEFPGFSAVLTPELRARAKQMLADNPTARAVQCRGFVKVSTPPTKDDIALANSRARNVCAYLKTLKPTLVTSTARGVGTTQLRRVTLAFSN